MYFTTGTASVNISSGTNKLLDAGAVKSKKGYKFGAQSSKVPNGGSKVTGNENRKPYNNSVFGDKTALIGGSQKNGTTSTTRKKKVPGNLFDYFKK